MIWVLFLDELRSVMDIYKMTIKFRQILNRFVLNDTLQAG